MFANNLKTIRKNKGMKSIDLAAACNISRQALLKLETGQNNPKIETLILLADNLNVSIDYLVRGDVRSNG